MLEGKIKFSEMTTPKEADDIFKKMLSLLSKEELNKIVKADLINTIAEVTVDADVPTDKQE